MSQVFHDIEKKILETLQKTPNQTPEQLSKNTELSIDQIRRGIEWLRLKDLAIVTDSEQVNISLGPNGLDSLKNGLPERKLIDLIKDNPKTFEQIRSVLSGAGFNAAIANAKKNGWIKIEKNDSGSVVSLKEKPIEISNSDKIDIRSAFFSTPIMFKGVDMNVIKSMNCEVYEYYKVNDGMLGYWNLKFFNF